MGKGVVTDECLALGVDWSTEEGGVCLVAQSCLTLCDPMGCSPPGSSVHGILQQECWSRLPCPPPGDLSDSGIKPACPAAPVLADGFFTTEPPGKAT